MKTIKPVVSIPRACHEDRATVLQGISLEIVIVIETTTEDLAKIACRCKAKLVSAEMLRNWNSEVPPSAPGPPKRCK